MTTQQIVVRSIADAAALVPWGLGFQPEDSFVVLGVNNRVPFARVDHPHDNEALIDVAASIGAAYRQHPGTVVLLSFTDDYAHALDTVTAVTAMLDGICEVHDAALVDGDVVTRIPSGEQTIITPEQRTAIAASMVATGRVMPRPHREVLREDLTNGWTEPVGEHIEDALQRVMQVCGDQMSAETEISWTKSRVLRFLVDEVALDDADAARLLVAINCHKEFRDSALAPVTTTTAPTLVALWRDLVRRAPEEVRTEAAVVLALVSWVAGDGATAWVALDVAQAAPDHVLATLVTAALENALHPSEWTAMSEGFTD